MKALYPQFDRILSAIRFGSLCVTTPDGIKHQYDGPEKGPQADIELHDWRVLLSVSLNGDVGFLDGYMQDRWQSSDLRTLLYLFTANAPMFLDLRHGNLLQRLVARLNHWRRRNNLPGSRKNIRSHYDLGNTFYALWLDPSMTYSSALYKDDTTDLLSAQHNKYDRVLAMLESRSGRFLEIGCGWGAMAERATVLGDFAYRGITLSLEQHRYIKHKNAATAVFLEDYRKQSGRFDQIVSIEMIEAVGERYWKTYFSRIAALLDAKGRAVIQAITIDSSFFDSYRRSTDIIRHHIFPGGMLMTHKIFEQFAACEGLRLVDSFSFAKSYVQTLRQWLANFDAKRKEVLALGFDEPFIRMWRFYLCACEAGFALGTTDVSQKTLEHA